MTDIQTKSEVVPMTPDGRLTRKAAARVLGYSHRTLDKWGLQGDGPAFSRIRGKIFYRIEVLQAWIAEQEGKTDDAA